MEPIVKIKFGSHLYGTSTPSSDLDIKGLYIPWARDILLQKVRPIVSFKRSKAHGERNTPQDIDYELYSPKRFLTLLAEGQPMALDMLFAPQSAMLLPAKKEWLQITELAPHLLTKQANSFIQYCKRQANKYGIKGSRIAAIRLILEFLTEAEHKYGPKEKLAVLRRELRDLSKDNEFLFLHETEILNGSTCYLEIGGKKVVLNATIILARTLTERLMDAYGKRALIAEKNENIDWKALSHAVRVGYEAIEFLTTGHITFPRPEALHLLKIKQGLLPFQEVGEEIEKLMLKIEEATLLSCLPDTFDPILIDDFIESLHRAAVLKEGY